MITEDYVSYEVAKLLKEKGFDEYCRYFYDCDTPDNGYLSNKKYGEYIHNSKVYDGRNLAACPTHQMAIAWLREKHKLLISVDASPIYGKVKNEKGRNTCGLLYWHYMASGVWMNDKYDPQQKAFVVSEKSYKKVVEAALKYSLENLI